MNIPKCDSCDSTTINGIYCHEAGCPNSKKVYLEGEWVKVIECSECGSLIYGNSETCDCFDDDDDEEYV